MLGSGLRTCQYTQGQEKLLEPSYDVVKDCSAPKSIAASIQPLVSVVPAPSITGISPMNNSRHGSFLMPEEIHVHDIHASITSYVYNLFLSKGETMEEVATKYFTVTCHWLPFISRMKMYANLRLFSAKPKAQVMILLLTMYLSIQLPGSATDTTRMRTSLYLKTKQLLALVQSTGILSIEVAQATLLIACYEYGHDLTSASHQSISSCAVIAYQLGWYDQAVNCSRSLSDFEEIKRTWWSIATFDRQVFPSMPI